MTVLPDAVVAIYRHEIGKEFDIYFASVTDYIACLDGERERVLVEAREAAANYAEILKRVPLREAPP
jgi:hypothetical protein